MSLPMRFEILADCPECRVEAALLEVYDEAMPSCRLGVPAEATCRLCGVRLEGQTSAGDSTPRPSGCPACGAALPPDLESHNGCPGCGIQATRILVQHPADLGDRSVLEAQLARWGHAEGSATLEEFLEGSFLGATLDEIHARIVARERVETSFDVFFHLFGHATVSSAAQGPVPRRAPAPPPTSLPPPRPSSGPAPTPRAFLYPIVSVMVADGVIKDVEREFIDRILEAEGHVPLRPEEIRVHRPAEIARAVPKARRTEAVELMVELAAVDGETDVSEIRIAKAYASAWGVPSALVNEWIERYKERHATGVRRFFRKLRSFFFVDVAEGAAAAPSGG